MAGEQEQQQQQQKQEETPKWAQDLHASLTEVGKGIGTLVDLAKQSQQRQVQPQQQQETEEVDEGSDLLDDAQLEVLPRRAFADRLLAAFETTLEGKLKPLTETLTNQQQQMLTSTYMQEAEKFAAKTPDFAEWVDEMQAIAKDNPNLSISRIYAVAKAENPAKVAEVAKKYQKEEPQQQPQQQRQRRVPLAMTPNSNSSESRNQRMTQEEASRDAWDKAVAQFGNIV